MHSQQLLFPWQNIANSKQTNRIVFICYTLQNLIIIIISQQKDFMGKKYKVIEQDPILKKHFKYEKRKKLKQQQRMKQKQQQLLQQKKKAEYRVIKKKVQKDIEQQVASSFHKKHMISKIQQKLKKSFIKKVKSNNQVRQNETNYQKIDLKNIDNEQNIYKNHYNHVVDENSLKKQVVEKNLQKIDHQVRSQLRELFGVQASQKPQEQKNQNLNDEPFLLQENLKQESLVSIDESPYFVTKAFLQNQQKLKINQRIENSLQKLISSYCDIVHIENQQEETLNDFRNMTIAHGLKHIQLCSRQEKSGGYTKCKFFIISPYVGDAKMLIEMIDEKFEEYKIKNRDQFQQIQDDSDYFRIGITINRKQKQLNYFTKFEKSDIILASPVALMTSASKQSKQNDFSYLSSVEILYIDRASVIQMQNWNHLKQLVKKINCMPKYESVTNSIMDVRQIYTSMKGKIYRQNIVFTEYNFPQLNALKFNDFHNWKGCLTNKPLYQKLRVETQYQQHFYKISPKKPNEDLEYRLDFFKRKFWDQLFKNQQLKRVVIFVNSYFQYVKLKVYFERTGASAETICQHTKKQKVQSKIAKFNNGIHRILLLTQRAYFYEICQIKKFNSIYFYSLPKNKQIYQQLIENLNLSQQGELGKITAIYSQFDALILQRIVGTNKCRQMLKEYCSNVNFII